MSDAAASVFLYLIDFTFIRRIKSLFCMIFGSKIVFLKN